VFLPSRKVLEPRARPSVCDSAFSEEKVFVLGVLERAREVGGMWSF
jgi:hypothetical protein